MCKIALAQLLDLHADLPAGPVVAMPGYLSYGYDILTPYGEVGNDLGALANFEVGGRDTPEPPFAHVQYGDRLSLLARAELQGGPHPDPHSGETPAVDKSNWARRLESPDGRPVTGVHEEGPDRMEAAFRGPGKGDGVPSVCEYGLSGHMRGLDLEQSLSAIVQSHLAVVPLVSATQHQDHALAHWGPVAGIGGSLGNRRSWSGPRRAAPPE